MRTKEDYMNLAIEMARATQGQTSPNPVVGCVVVKHGKVIGLGAHLRAGEEHAEVNALNQAGEQAEGADLFVTLEPCSHYGNTPPCADLIVRKKIKKVYIATLDPNPLVSGSGVNTLKSAGILVEVGLCAAEANEINKTFLHYMKTKKPFVTLKTAVTMDGKTAASTGDSKWITSEDARLDVHEYRHQHDGILVGINTIIKDNPRLTTRLPRGGKNPIRLVLDTTLQIPIDANVVTDNEARTMIICGRSASEQKQKQLEQLGIIVKRMNNNKLEIEEILQWLGSKKITSLFVEGGSTVLASFLESGCFQEVIMYMAPKLLGGQNSLSSFGGIGAERIAQSKQLHFKKIEQIGPDLKIIAVPVQVGGE